MRDKLLKLYNQLHDAYGLQGWWPAETAFEVIIGAILVQSTAWRNVIKAIDNLKTANLLTPARLGKVPPTQLETLVRPSGYYRAKAKTLRAFLTHLRLHHANRLDSLFGTDLPTLREELLSIHGIGEETADSILLYAAGKPIFVIDTYTHRLLTRLSWTEGKYQYGKLEELFMAALPHDLSLFNEFHALIVRHGAEVCKKTPRCGVCPLQTGCPFHWAAQSIQTSNTVV